MCGGSVPVKNVVLHSTYLLAQEEVEHILRTWLCAAFKWK